MGYRKYGRVHCTTHSEDMWKILIVPVSNINVFLVQTVKEKKNIEHGRVLLVDSFPKEMQTMNGE